MYVGTQFGARHETDIRQLAQLGVEHVDVPLKEHWTEWTVDLLTSYREKYAKYGINVETIHSPLGSRDAFTNDMSYLFLGPSDEKERELDSLCEIIRMASEAGLERTALQHHHPRTPAYTAPIPAAAEQPSRHSTTPTSTSLCRNSRAGQRTPTRCGNASTTSSPRIAPVANEYKVQMACHPQDPGIKDNEYRGVARVMGTVDGLKKFVAMHENPYHGLNFCQGTVSEMLEKPGEEIYDVIRYFGSRKKIFNVHFRNIKGGVLDFIEVFPDEGDVDMLKAARTYKEVDYPYMLMPDHVPGIEGEEAHQVGFAYCYGYIHAIIQAVNEA